MRLEEEFQDNKDSRKTVFISSTKDISEKIHKMELQDTGFIVYHLLRTNSVNGIYEYSISGYDDL
jgi:hypothetical protein